MILNNINISGRSIPNNYWPSPVYWDLSYIDLQSSDQNNDVFVDKQTLRYFAGEEEEERRRWFSDF